MRYEYSAIPAQSQADDEAQAAEQERIDQADYDQWCLESAARNARVSAADLDEFDRAMHGLGRLIDLADGYVAAHGRKAA